VSKVGTLSAEANDPVVRLNVPVTNKGRRDGTEVVQVYIRDLQDADGPLRSLRAFRRVDVKAGQRVDVELNLTPRSFELFDVKTNTMHAHPGRYQILYGNSSRLEELKSVELELQ
jgi:beta-glucosidase